MSGEDVAPDPAELGSTLTIADGRRRTPAAMSPEPHLFLALECIRPYASSSARFSLSQVDEVVIGRGAARGYTRLAYDGVGRLAVGGPAPVVSSSRVSTQ